MSKYKIEKVCYDCGKISSAKSFDSDEDKCPACGSSNWITLTRQEQKEIQKQEIYGERLLAWIENKAGKPFSPEAVKKREEYNKELIRKVQTGEIHKEYDRKERERKGLPPESEPEKKPYVPPRSVVLPPTVTCPYCGSTDTKKITAVGRMASFSVFGIFSGKLGKQWHCNKCKSDF